MSEPRTLFDKLWEKHVVSSPTNDQPAIIYIDLHLVHEVTSPQAFDELRRRGISLRRPDLTIATMDHSIPTSFEKGKPVYLNESARDQVEVLRKNCEEFGVTLYAIGSSEQGIVHVIGPELGLTRPGRTIVCGDSHTSTHGAFGSLAFGIGTTEVAHVFATQCLLQRKPKTFEVRLDGELAKGVTAKDVILYVIRHVGVDGGRGYVIEYRGTCIQSLSMEERMTVCNMSIEAGARAGIIAPDDTTFSYLAGREFSPKGAAWDDAVADWRALVTDDEARFDKTVVLDASVIEPMVTYGTNPSMSVAIGDSIPSDLTGTEDEQALAYMKMSRGDVIVGTPVDIVFIGSCTNARIEDLRLAASIMQGRKVADGVRVLVVPGSQEVKRLATNEGLDLVFKDAGAEWHEPGCSMCLGMNGDTVGPGQLAVSTSNRNFEGRQGMGARTVLASPLTAAATAVSGVIADARQFIRG